MAVFRFEDIIAWQKAQDLAVEIYLTYKELKEYSFKDQIFRATVSISNNIAEGFDRSSNADFARFLYVSLGSCSEVKSMLYLSERLDFISSEKAEDLIVKTQEISKIITGLIKALEERDYKK